MNRSTPPQRFLRSSIWRLVFLLLVGSCQDHRPINPAVLSADVAHAWMQMQIRLTLSTTGYNSIVSNRSFGYAGITMYEAVLPGIEGNTSLLAQIGGNALTPSQAADQYYWPESLNAAMASLTRQFFESTSAANLKSIDSLETIYKAHFQAATPPDKLTNAETYGRQVANAIFEWSKTDGGHQAYKNVTDPTYTPPVGPGLWVPTPTAAPILPRWDNNRTFIANSAVSSQPGPPTPYSEDPSSAFYAMVNEVYTTSQSLTKTDTTTARFWADTPGNLNVPAHATNILTQLLVTTNQDLFKAAAAYAQHGIALSDAAVSTFKTKYTYNLLRPFTYIRNVLKKTSWNPVIPTPPHPEYSAAHAVVSAASAAVLEKLFGTSYKFSDNSYASSYGIRSYNTFQEYAQEAGRSRLLGGIHYAPSISTGLTQGAKVGSMINQLKIK
ncbi:vanadium-dependent haloperoxidase [Spirosoma sp. BT702]|uniref:Vanadium-dependent haloperoxidase n=1 Tax=Spirosoma profusum TaxID=2771354 RepID=A0A927AWV0_9BACT|nr:vanadium-dependent haloperoxidase [Spirosoma profusum]MBD2705836.1 vanadium-dependent haloperoxidase [Spirosoma profusum]